MLRVMQMKSYCSTSRMYHLRILDFNILYTFIYIMTWRKLHCLEYYQELFVVFCFSNYYSGKKLLRLFIKKSQQIKSLSFSFTGSVKLKGIIISGEDDDSHPSEIRLWVFVSSANLTLLWPDSDCSY